MKLLIVGCGSIGSVITDAAELMPEIEKILLYDLDPGKSKKLAGGYSKTELLLEIDFAKSEVNLAIEAACQQAAKDLIPIALENEIDGLIMSVGAFADKDFQNRCFAAVSAHDSFLLIPSGAIAGIDALKAGARAKLDVVRLTTTKPIKGLKGVKYLEEKGIDVENIAEKTTLYSGPASEAVRLFPANVNVAATVSLAGIGFEKTQIEIICDPNAEVNSHNLFVKGEFGEMEAITRNLPSPDNPRTSYLASLSAVSTLRAYSKKVWVGV